MSHIFLKQNHSHCHSHLLIPPQVVSLKIKFILSRWTFDDFIVTKEEPERDNFSKYPWLGTTITPFTSVPLGPVHEKFPPKFRRSFDSRMGKNGSIIGKLRSHNIPYRCRLLVGKRRSNLAVSRSQPEWGWLISACALEVSV